MFCRKCGKEIPDDSVFCPKCGAEIDNNIKPVQEEAERVNLNKSVVASNTAVISDPMDILAPMGLCDKKPKSSKKTAAIVLSVIGVIIIAVIITVIAVNNANAHHEFEYHLLDNDTYIIDGYVGADVNVIIPATINNKPVTKIGEKAFNNSKIQSVTIGENVNEVGKSAFEMCQNLTALNFQTNPEKEPIVIDDMAFSYCTSLKAVTMPAVYTTVGIMAFYGCKSLSEIDLSHIFVYGMGAFSKTDLKTVSISGFGKYDDIGALGVFGDCKNLETVYISESVTVLPQETFLRCTALKEVTWKVDVSDQLAYINSSAFAGCTELKMIIGANDKTMTCPTEVYEYYEYDGMHVLPINGFYVSDGAFSGCEKFKDPEPTTQHNEFAGTFYLGKETNEIVKYAYDYKMYNMFDNHMYFAFEASFIDIYDSLGKISCGLDYSNTFVTQVTYDDNDRYLSSGLGKTDFIHPGMKLSEVFEILGEEKLQYITRYDTYFISYNLYGYNIDLYLSGNSSNSIIESINIIGTGGN